MILLAFSKKNIKLSGLSPIWYILMIGLPSSVVADFLLLPVRLPQAARVAPRAMTLADANAYFFPIFHKKNLLYVIFFLD